MEEYSEIHLGSPSWLLLILVRLTAEIKYATFHRQNRERRGWKSHSDGAEEEEEEEQGILDGSEDIVDGLNVWASARVSPQLQPNK